MKLAETHGVNSRTKSLQLLNIIMIRAEYDSGKRGNKYAKNHGTSPQNYNKIGRRISWVKLGVGDW